MELGIDIKVDNAGLKQQLDRAKREFLSLNTSVGGGFGGSTATKYGSVMNRTAAAAAANAESAFSKFQSGLNEVSPALGGMLSGITSLAAPMVMLGSAVAAAGFAVKKFIDTTNENRIVARESRITGLSAGMVKDITAVGGEDSMTPIKKMLRNASEALTGNQEMQNLFKMSGVNINEIEGASADDLVKHFKVAFSKINDPAKRAQVSKIFGKNGFDISEMFSKLNKADEPESVARAGYISSKLKKLSTGFWRALDYNVTDFVAAMEFGAESLAKKFGVKGFGVSGKDISTLKGQNIGSSEDTLVTREAALAQKRLDEKEAKARDAYEAAKLKNLPLEERISYLRSQLIPQLEKEVESATGADYWEVKKKLNDAMSDVMKFESKSKRMPSDSDLIRTSEMERIKPFGADSLAQSGLFSGSSLLMNPTLTVAQEQLKVLNLIATNTGQNPFAQ
jgi:hypothetical protein